MNYLESIVLGVIQGLTEFLPVSSSGHLEIGKALFASNELPAESMFMTVILHVATALSTIVVFKKDIGQIFQGLLKRQNNKEFQFSLKIVLSMIPAAIVGVAFDKEIEAFFTGQILLVGFMLLITGLLLFLADKAKSTHKPVSRTNAVVIGISQAIAILPGISRSGATISTAVLLGIDKEKAARFSFLMVVPLILGKVAKDILDGAFTHISDSIGVYIVGFLAAFITGLFACRWMIQLVKKSKLLYFSIYCFVVGLLAIAVSM